MRVRFKTKLAMIGGSVTPVLVPEVGGTEGTTVRGLEIDEVGRLRAELNTLMRDESTGLVSRVLGV